MTNERHEKALEAADAARARLFVTKQSKDGSPERLMDIIKVRNECMEEGIRTYLQAMDAVIVPKTPEPEMIGAWYRYKNGHHWPDEQPALDTSDYGAYRAMLSKAPNHFTNGE